jgi:mono/diheme cytochrome c family protein
MWSSRQQSSREQSSRGSFRSVGATGAALALVAMSGWGGTAAAQRPGDTRPGPPAGSSAHVAARGAGAGRAAPAQVLRGRTLVLQHGCADCHGGRPLGSEGYLAGYRPASIPPLEFLIGPCAVQPGATPCFRTRPRNLTPDNTTGMGRFSERQIFNALRYGLRPGETPDVEITSSTPGQGNFPADPKYLAPPMPWPAFRHMADQELRAIAAYLKQGVKPVSNRVPDSEGPPDFWAGEYTAEKIGRYPAPPFPTPNERKPQ